MALLAADSAAPLPADQRAPSCAAGGQKPRTCRGV